MKNEKYVKVMKETTVSINKKEVNLLDGEI